MRPSGPRHFSILSSPLSLSLISSLSTSAFLSSYFLLAFLLLSVGRFLLLPSSLRSDSTPLCRQGYRHTATCHVLPRTDRSVRSVSLRAHKQQCTQSHSSRSKAQGDASTKQGLCKSYADAGAQARSRSPHGIMLYLAGHRSEANEQCLWSDYLLSSHCSGPRVITRVGAGGGHTRIQQSHNSIRWWTSVSAWLERWGPFLIIQCQINSSPTGGGITTVTLFISQD